MLNLSTRYRIMCERDDGTKFQAFTWVGTEQSGIDRGWEDAKQNNVTVVRVWAEPIPRE